MTLPQEYKLSIRTADQTRRSLEARQRSEEDGLRAGANPDLERNPQFAVLRALRAAESQLASMSEAERKRPAWVKVSGSSTETGLVPENTPGAAPVMTFDSTFFDTKLPRHTIQIALVRELPTMADRAHRGAPSITNQDARVNLLLLQQTDWRQFVDRFVR